MIDIESDNPVDIKNKGDEFVKNGDYNAAIKYYQKAIELDPKYISAWNNLGYSFFKLGKKDDAARCKAKINELISLLSEPRNLEEVQKPTQPDQPISNISAEEENILGQGTVSQESVEVHEIKDVSLTLPKFLSINAYHVLGLDVSSDLKTIQKRARELTNRLKIEDLPEYGFDIEPPINFRNENSVKEAVQKLSSPKTCYTEVVFWFNFGAIGEKNQLYDYLKDKNYNEIISFFDKVQEAEQDGYLISRKNLALFQCILLNSENFKYYLEPSLQLWHEIFNSPKYWNLILNDMKQNLGYEISKEIINALQKQTISLLGDLYTDITLNTSDPDYFLEFKKQFGVKSEKFDRAILEPGLHDLQNLLDELNALEIKRARIDPETKITDRGDLQKIKTTSLKIDNLVTEIYENCTILIQFGLDADPQVEMVKDKIVKNLREISNKIYSEWDNLKETLKIIKIAREIAGNSSYGLTLNNDINELENLVKIDPLIKKIDGYLGNEQFESALEIIQQNEKIKGNPKLQEALISRKKSSVSGLAYKNHYEAMRLFQSKKYTESKSYFNKVSSLVYSNLELFNFNKETIDQILNEIPKRINYALHVGSFDNLNQFREDIIKIAKEHFEGTYEENVLVILIDSSVYPKLIDMGIYSNQEVNGKPIKNAPTLYTVNGIGAKLYGDTQYFTILWIPILPIARYSVHQVGSDTYQFYGKLQLHSWQKIWQYVFMTVVGFFIINYWIILIMVLWFIILRIQNKSII